MWGEASHLPLSRDSSTQRAPGTCKSHHKVLPPLLHLSGCSQHFRASTPLRIDGNSASRRLKHMERCSLLRGYKTFVIFFLLIFWKPIRKAQPGCAVDERLVSAVQHCKAAGPPKRWQNWSLSKWIPTNVSYF